MNYYCLSYIFRNTNLWYELYQQNRYNTSTLLDVVVLKSNSNQDSPIFMFYFLCSSQIFILQKESRYSPQSEDKNHQAYTSYLFSN